MTQSQTNHLGRTSIALHWLTALLFVAAYATMEFREALPKGSMPREAMKSWHYTVGLSILALAWVRLLFRVLTRGRGHDPASRWQAAASGIAHIALYAMMIVLPLIGWMIVSAEGHSVSYFGVDLPPLIGANDRLADQFEDLHELIARAGYGLIGIHTLAALVHHYVLRDSTLARMLPARS